MRIEKLNKVYVLLAREMDYDKDNKVTNLAVQRIKGFHAYLSKEGASEGQEKFISTLLMSCDTAEPIYYDHGPNWTLPENLKGYIIHYDNGGRIEVEIEIEELTLED